MKFSFSPRKSIIPGFCLQLNEIRRARVSLAQSRFGIKTDRQAMGEAFAGFADLAWSVNDRETTVNVRECP